MTETEITEITEIDAGTEPRTGTGTQTGTGTHTDTGPTSDEIRSWLIERITHYLPELSGRIGPETELAGQGLDSVYAVALCGEIEDTWQLTIEPTLIWDSETVEALTESVAALVRDRPPT